MSIGVSSDIQQCPPRGSTGAGCCLSAANAASPSLARIWHITPEGTGVAKQGWRKMFYLDPITYLQAPSRNS